MSYAQYLDIVKDKKLPQLQRQKALEQACEQLQKEPFLDLSDRRLWSTIFPFKWIHPQVPIMKTLCKTMGILPLESVSPKLLSQESYMRSMCEANLMCYQRADETIQKSVPFFQDMLLSYAQDIDPLQAIFLISWCKDPKIKQDFMDYATQILPMKSEAQRVTLNPEQNPLYLQHLHALAITNNKAQEHLATSAITHGMRGLKSQFEQQLLQQLQPEAHSARPRARL